MRFRSETLRREGVPEECDVDNARTGRKNNGRRRRGRTVKTRRGSRKIILEKFQSAKCVLHIHICPRAILSIKLLCLAPGMTSDSVVEYTNDSLSLPLQIVAKRFRHIN